MSIIIHNHHPLISTAT